MKLLSLAVLSSLSLAPALLFAEGPREYAAAASVAIYLSFDGEHSERAVDAMKREAERLTTPSGFHIQWRLLDSRPEEETFADLMVVRGHGKCNMERIQLLFSELGLEGEGGP